MTSETELLAKEALILDLFDGYLSAKPSAENLRRYVAAVESLSVEAVRRSVTQFQQGLVERDNSDFAPSAETFARNARQWQAALDKNLQVAAEMHNGLIECDWGHGRVNLKGLTTDEQNQIIDAKGRAPDGSSLAYRSLPEIREALQQKDLAQVAGGKTFAAPRLQRVTE